jgi:hypothetical protein
LTTFKEGRKEGGKREKEKVVVFSAHSPLDLRLCLKRRQTEARGVSRLFEMMERRGKRRMAVRSVGFALKGVEKAYTDRRTMVPNLLSSRWACTRPKS